MMDEKKLLIIMALLLCAYLAFILPSSIAKEIILVALGGVFGVVSSERIVK